MQFYTAFAALAADKLSQCKYGKCRKNCMYAMATHRVTRCTVIDGLRHLPSSQLSIIYYFFLKEKWSAETAFINLKGGNRMEIFLFCI